MEFCQNCNNMLIPKDGQFYCRTCNLYFRITEGEEIMKKIIKRDESFLDTKPVFLGI